MDTKDINTTTKYISNLEEELYGWDGDGVQWQQELPTLHIMIETLMRQTFEEKDPTSRSLLATVEFKARRCRECILNRTGMKN